MPLAWQSEIKDRYLILVRRVGLSGQVNPLTYPWEGEEIYSVENSAAPTRTLELSLY